VVADAAHAATSAAATAAALSPATAPPPAEVARMSSRFVGVHRSGKKRKPWTAACYWKGKQHHLGYFLAEEEAAQTYDRFVRDKELDRKINFPLDGDSKLSAQQAKASSRSARGIASRYVGVFHSRSNPLRPWRASCMSKRKHHHLGIFGSEEEAALAYDAFVVEHDLQRELNFPAMRRVLQVSSACAHVTAANNSQAQQLALAAAAGGAGGHMALSGMGQCGPGAVGAVNPLGHLIYVQPPSAQQQQQSHHLQHAHQLAQQAMPGALPGGAVGANPLSQGVGGPMQQLPPHFCHAAGLGGLTGQQLMQNALAMGGHAGAGLQLGGYALPLCTHPMGGGHYPQVTSQAIAQSMLGGAHSLPISAAQMQQLQLPLSQPLGSSGIAAAAGAAGGGGGTGAGAASPCPSPGYLNSFCCVPSVHTSAPSCPQQQQQQQPLQPEPNGCAQHSAYLGCGSLPPDAGPSDGQFGGVPWAITTTAHAGGGCGAALPGGGHAAPSLPGLGLPQDGGAQAHGGQLPFGPQGPQLQHATPLAFPPNAGPTQMQGVQAAGHVPVMYAPNTTALPVSVTENVALGGDVLGSAAEMLVGGGTEPLRGPVSGMTIAVEPDEEDDESVEEAPGDGTGEGVKSEGEGEADEETDRVEA
jgi:hypothetical protein